MTQNIPCSSNLVVDCGEHTAVVKLTAYSLVRLTAGIYLDSLSIQNKIVGKTTADRGAHLVRQPDQHFAHHTVTFWTCETTSVN